MILEIAGLKVKTVIGVYPFERVITQELIIDLNFPITLPVEDDLKTTLDYADLSQKIIQFFKEKEFQLIETAVASLCHYLKNTCSIATGTLKLTKPYAIREASGVSVTLHW